MRYRFYILFATLPFGHITFFSHINVLEIAILFNLLLLPFSHRKEPIRLCWVDILVFLYGMWELFSVAISSYSFYES